MQLYVARLCLDCDEVYDAHSCPLCGSEAFAYLKRWVPQPERRMRKRPTTSPEADVYRELISPNSADGKRSRLLRGGAFGVALLAAAGWFWQRNTERQPRPDDTPDAP